MIEIKDGAVFRDGEQVGLVEGESLLVPEKLHHKVQAQIERETGLKVVVDVAPPDEKPPEDVAPTPPEPPKPGESNPPAPPEPPTPPVDAGIPAADPEPPKDYRGDKTPAYVEWMFRNHPEAAAKRYANRKIER